MDASELTDQFFEKLEDFIKALEKDIERKLDSVRKERQLAITTLEEIIKKTYNENSHYNSLNHKNFVGIRMYGSMASGLAIDSSDVDLAVTGLDFHGNKDSHLKEMRELYHQLSYLKSKYSIKFIETATVPVIKLIIDLQKIHEQTSKGVKKSLGGPIKSITEISVSQSTHEIDPSMRYLGIDITFEGSQSMVNDQFGNFSQSQSIISSQPSKINLGIQCITHIQTLRMEFPDLKPIVMVLKRLLQLKDLNQPYHGGISSYSLVLMISTFLNRCDSESMGINLTEFLNYYGNFFDPQTTQLDGKCFSTRFSGNTLGPMVVIDPLNPRNNTTRSSFRIAEIQYVFKRAHSVIIQKLEEFKASGNSGPEFDVIKYIVDNQDNILM